MFRRELLSTVFRNVPDAGGGIPAPKVEDAVAPVVVAAEPVVAEPAAPASEAVAPAPEPVVEKPVEASAEPAKDFAAETLLTAEEPKADTKPEAPVEAPKADDKEPAKDAGGEAKPDDKKPEEPKPEAPKEAPVYAYEFPEGVKVDQEALKPINETFAKHNIAPDVAKDLMGLHVAEMQKYANHVVQQSQEQQQKVWAETRGLWRTEGQSDERIGGSGYQTTLRQAAEVRDKLVPKEDMAAFNRMMLVTGAGDHPEFLRLMKNAHRFVGEPGVPGVQGNPTAHNGQPGGKRRLRDTYAKQA